MTPSFAGGVLAFLMCFTLTCYFFRIPDDLRAQGRPGYWGQQDAEFNWCEVDYSIIEWVAEPVNTFSNAVYIVLPAAFLVMHPCASQEIAALLFLQTSIGVGSVLFHASLRYSMQLVDEIPMLWFGLLLVTACFHRLGFKDLRAVAMVFAAAVTMGVLSTRQHSGVHEAFRGTMAISFCIALIGTAWSLAAIANRLGELPSEKFGKLPQRMEQLYMVCFLMFVSSVMCWLADNYYCPVLQKMPYGLPYPHLHMWWHLLTAGALHCIAVLLLADEQRTSAKMRVACKCGLPALTFA